MRKKTQVRMEYFKKQLVAYRRWYLRNIKKINICPDRNNDLDFEVIYRSTIINGIIYGLALSLNENECHLPDDVLKEVGLCAFSVPLVKKRGKITIFIPGDNRSLKELKKS